jgi:hypothetical protein
MVVGKRQISLFLSSLFYCSSFDPKVNLLTHTMINRVSRVIVLLISFVFARSQIYLHHTNDGLDIEQYDCVIVQPSLSYCRRPREAINLTRGDNHIQSCVQNGGEMHLFSELRSTNITINTLQHHWTTTREIIEEYSLYLTDLRLSDGHLCRCLHLGLFGNNCEYQLPVGQTFEETLKWQLTEREKNEQEVQIYGDVVCYETLECDSGVLCLDWREICDGIQHCLEGKDEENCNRLEMNICDDDEYRCTNGMCIADEFFLDGELDCLDWSDEMAFKDNRQCPTESVTTECDDHICLPNQWSCSDGQCISDRLAFQKSAVDLSCDSRRDQYFVCETHWSDVQWTMPNGRCFRGKGYVVSLVTNLSDDEQCEYLLKCALSQGAEINCPCDRDSRCAEKFNEVCTLPLISYPLGAIFAPFLFFFYNRTLHWKKREPALILMNGTVRCQDSYTSVTKMVQFTAVPDVRQLIEDHFCDPLPTNLSLSNIVGIRQECHHMNESSDLCNEWNRCFSLTRINDGWWDCLNEKDEFEKRETMVHKSCTRVRPHRFHCSSEQPTCLRVMSVGDRKEQCQNGFDELWSGMGQTLSSIGCNDRRQDQCSLLRKYIDGPWTSSMKGVAHSKRQIPFRSYCDTFENLQTREDENLVECRQWWVCPENQWTCQTGQCIDHEWLLDEEWDCADASDTHRRLHFIANWTLKRASAHNFTNRSYFIPDHCNESHPFLCLSSRATQQGFSCFNISQIGDGHIDCAGAIDERNTLQHCSQSSVLGYDFKCSSTDICIPFFHHCWTDQHRCFNRSDDDFWCSRQKRTSTCFDLNDFTCFNGRCAKGGRCNQNPDCFFAEDEYMCDYLSSFTRDLIPYRRWKRLSQGSGSNVLRLPLYPPHANTTPFDSQSILMNESSISPMNNTSSPFLCNRGLGVLITNETTTNQSIVCFCPPQYYGEKCSYHADRLSVLVHLDLSQSIYIDGNDLTLLLRLLVLFMYNDEVLQRDQFHLHPLSQIINNLNKKRKMISHFVYPRSPSFLRGRQQRFFNRSDLLLRHPYSVRIELYQIRLKEAPFLIDVWKYALSFDHLPVTRLAKVLHLTSFFDHRRNPCSSQPCHSNERCHPLMNDRSNFICLCPTNFTGPHCSIRDPQCDQGYCLSGSLCQPHSRSSSPFCVCPSNRYGRRCSIEHDLCLFNPCLNNGSCFPDSRPDQVVCLCTKEYGGSRCQWKRPSIHLSLSTHLSYAGAVIQFFDIDTSSLDFIALHQQVFKTLPEHIEYYHRDQNTSKGIILAKLYSSYDEHSSANIHLLSLHADVFSLIAATEISQINLCLHLRSSRVYSDSSPIRYHQICIENLDLLCFRDDIYLCLCAENHTRVECFLYDDGLDRCPHCLAQGRCLKGNLRRPNDFLCLCPACHSGRECQFNTKSFSFTLDQLFFPDLLSDERQMTTISLLSFFSLLLFVLALPNNIFSLVTLLRPTCRRHGVGHYLFALSIINQVSLTLLIVRLLHLIVNISGTSSSSSQTNDLLCKSLNYLLSSSSRMVYWLTSLISIERLYSTLSLRGQWLKQPRIARRLIVFICFSVFISDLYELFYYTSFSTQIDGGQGSLCVLQISTRDRSLWMTFHLLFLILHSFVPFLINLCSTIVITFVVIKKKMNTHEGNHFISHRHRCYSVNIFLL